MLSQPKSSKLLQDTPLSYIYTSKFADLKPAILTYYDFQNRALSHVSWISDYFKGTVLEDGVVKVMYDNQKRPSILIPNTVIKDGFEINPKNYVVVFEGLILSGNYEMGDQS